MSHELYESWLVSEQPLTLEQKDELKSHLQSCPRCRQIAAGWRSARTQMTKSGLASPTPGFNLRWQQTLAERRLQKQTKNTRWLLLALVVSSAISLTALVLFLSNSLAIVDWWLHTTLTVERTFGWLKQISLLVQSWLGGLPSFLPPAVIILILSAGFTFLLLLWVSIVKRLSIQGAPQS